MISVWITERIRYTHKCFKKRDSTTFIIIEFVSSEKKKIMFYILNMAEQLRSIYLKLEGLVNISTYVNM